MPKLRSHSRPLVYCAYPPCEVVFRKWRKRLYCSDPCRKNNWRASHKPYYKDLQRKHLDKKKAERRQARRFVWVQDGAETEIPVRLSIEEALAQASPETVKEIQELIKREG